MKWIEGGHDMGLRIQRVAGVVIVVGVVLVLLFLNLQSGNTLWSFGFQVLLVGVVLNVIGVFSWLFCKQVERFASVSAFGLYVVYGGLFLLFLGAVSMALAPVFHSIFPPFVSPD